MLQCHNSPRDADVIPFSFGIDQLALLNFIYQHRLRYLPQHCVESRKTPVTFITKLTSFLSCLSQQCFHITELSSRLSKAWKGSLPRVYALPNVSPTYFDLQAWQTNSYVTPVLRHDPFPSCRSTEHQSCSVSLTTKCLCLPAEKLAIICRKLY